RGHGIGVTVVNFGNVATPEVLDDIETGLFSPQVPIPIEDLLATYDYLLQISAATVPQSIDLRQKIPGGIGE
ncbi:MAG: SDR family NAD(P)-dependent oxidoreductase, partial [Pseudomonadota bacterium]